MSGDQGQSALEELSFEAAYRELEETVQRLEAGDLTLEEAIALYERGMMLARSCSDALDAAELQVQEVAVSHTQQQSGVFFNEEG
jgi:exodeoxyribonuclease VII small subunit